jgi:hypothetical protein
MANKFFIFLMTAPEPDGRLPRPDAETVTPHSSRGTFFLLQPQVSHHEGGTLEFGGIRFKRHYKAGFNGWFILAGDLFFDGLGEAAGIASGQGGAVGGGDHLLALGPRYCDKPQRVAAIAIAFEP